ncbi:MAG: MraY family glycosyltransferase [Elusimicrobiota bacterium]
MLYLYTFLTSFLITLFFVPLMKKIAVKYDILDKPVTAVKTHKQPVPYLGGVAIWIGLIAVLFAIRFFTNFETGTLRNLRGIVLAGTCIMALGIVDDIKPLHFTTKFFWQIIAATILILFDMKIKFIQPSYLGIILTYLWIIGVTNAFNLIDVMDGLSSGVAVIAALSFFFINAPKEAIYVNFAAVGLAGSALGFLKYNLPPAGIYMGDTGSLFIGFVLAAISLGANYTFINNVAVFTPILILAVAIFDTFYIMFKRNQKHKSMFVGSHDHFALRLRKMGWPQNKILCVIYLIAIFCGLMAYIITRVSYESAMILYAGIAIIGYWIAKFLGRVEIN